MTKQISPEYLAKLVEYNSRKASVELLIDEKVNSPEQFKSLTTERDLLQKLIDDFDAKVKEWEGLKSKDKIDHVSGFVTSTVILNE